MASPSILTGLDHPFFFRYILLHILPPPGLRRSRSSMASLTALLRPPALLLPCSPPHGSGLAPVRRAHSYSSPPPTGLAPALLLPQLTIETTCVADGLAGLAILTVTELEARPQESPASPASPWWTAVNHPINQRINQRIMSRSRGSRSRVLFLKESPWLGGLFQVTGRART